jgi:hypothetical protein
MPTDSASDIHGASMDPLAAVAAVTPQKFLILGCA